jgi:hypothetical protein
VARCPDEVVLQVQEQQGLAGLNGRQLTVRDLHPRVGGHGWGMLGKIRPIRANHRIKRRRPRKGKRRREKWGEKVE